MLLLFARDLSPFRGYDMQPEKELHSSVAWLQELLQGPA